MNEYGNYTDESEARSEIGQEEVGQKITEEAIGVHSLSPLSMKQIDEAAQRARHADEKDAAATYQQYYPQPQYGYTSRSTQIPRGPLSHYDQELLLGSNPLRRTLTRVQRRQTQPEMLPPLITPALVAMHQELIRRTNGGEVTRAMIPTKKLRASYKAALRARQRGYALPITHDEYIEQSTRPRRIAMFYPHNTPENRSADQISQRGKGLSHRWIPAAGLAVLIPMTMSTDNQFFVILGSFLIGLWLILAVATYRTVITDDQLRVVNTYSPREPYGSHNTEVGRRASRSRTIYQITWGLNRSYEAAHQTLSSVPELHRAAVMSQVPQRCDNIIARCAALNDTLTEAEAVEARIARVTAGNAERLPEHQLLINQHERTLADIDEILDSILRDLNKIVMLVGHLEALADRAELYKTVTMSQGVNTRLNELRRNGINPYAAALDHTNDPLSKADEERLREEMTALTGRIEALVGFNAAAPAEY